jgi:transposase
LKRKRIHPEDMISDQVPVLYVGIDAHERESQLAVFDQSGSLLKEERIPTSELELMDSIVERLDGEISHVVMKDANARLLDTLPGVAPYTALFLSSAVGDINRFLDSKHLCAYLGLVPSLHQSGDVSLTGHITKEGNKWLRRNMVECARVAVRKDPHLKEFYLKLTRKRGERKALIAVARRMTAYAFWMLKRNQTYEELSPWHNS